MNLRFAWLRPIRGGWFLASLLSGLGLGAAEPVPRVPVVASDWWRICEMPDLGALAGPDARRQHVVDHGFIRNAAGRWTLWACLRGTGVGRLLYGWEGDSLERGPWEPRGVVARAEARFGEKTQPQEAIQAPFFLHDGKRWLCFYNSAGVRLMTSDDGRTFSREIPGRASNLLYADGGRDAMALYQDGRYYVYSTISTTDRRGYIIVRTSADLREWTPAKNVCEGGRGGTGPVSAESPFVVALDGFFYLFRASSNNGMTYVYRSRSPEYFGVNDDSNLIAELKVKAPEIVRDGNVFHLSDLADFRGIKLARLEWRAEK